MKTIGKKFLSIAAIALLAGLMFTSCDKDDDDDVINDVIDDQLENIVEIAVADDNFSTLVAALSKADLVSTLEGNGPFTVFAPTNAAFNALLADLGVSSLDELTAEQLEPILLYHVVSGKVMSSALNNGYVSTLSPGADNTKASLLVNVNGGVSLNSTTNVTTADIEASNGVIHVVDEVLLPPTVVDIAVNNPDFSILVDAVVKAGLVETLNGNGPFTVFAPTNDAFEALFAELEITGIEDLTAEDLVPILQYHVVSGNVLSSDLSSGEVATLNGTFSVDVGSSVTINGMSNVLLTDVQGTNGVVHVIDKVLLPEEEPQTIVDIASADDNFSSLVAALTKADLVSTLQGDGAFTVFAPTNDAFDALLSDLGVASLDDLTAEQLVPILLYHVVSGKVMSTDLTNGYVATLSSGPESTNVDLLVDLSDGVALNGNTNVTTANIDASNGVIHVIDKVLLPPTIVGIAINNPNFSILVEAVVKADLVETLSGDGPFTVFAPTNDAFEALFAELEITGIEDLTAEDLVPILQYHVVSGNVLSTDLSSGNVSTLNGDITINVGSSVTINGDTNVILTDVQGSNGVVHVIDKVLLPPTK
ncbi:MAG: fasciclin domain-containing protein [Bacteroidales bacterium]|jgi:transforming growth factor-beta-induced protein|nr:fasciclin domain-containing protein [Bacteroidales bacterium]